MNKHITLLRLPPVQEVVWVRINKDSGGGNSCREARILEGADVDDGRRWGGADRPAAGIQVVAAQTMENEEEESSETAGRTPTMWR
jgi:hypothetical protein